MAIVQQFLVVNNNKEGKEKVVATFNDKKEAAVYDKKVNCGYDLLDYVLEAAAAKVDDKNSLEYDVIKKVSKIDESALENLCLLLSLKGDEVTKIIKGRKSK